MSKIRISVRFDPGEAQMEGIRFRAEEMLEKGYISALPIITHGPSPTFPDSAGIIDIECPEQDFNIWFAFYQGIDCARGERDLYCGR